jgi:hypothetical protein
MPPQPVRTAANQFVRIEQEDHAHLRRLWQMSPAQRAAAMRRGELSDRELAAWSGRYPEQVPRLNGEYEWIAAFTPEVCE